MATKAEKCAARHGGTRSDAMRKHPVETITFRGDLPASWEGQLLIGVQYSLGKQRRWELLNGPVGSMAEAFTEEHFEKKMVRTVSEKHAAERGKPQTLPGIVRLTRDAPYQKQRKHVHCERQQSTCEGHIQTLTSKDGAQSRYFPHRCGYREQRQHQIDRKRTTKPGNLRALKHKDLNQKEDVNDEADWYLSWSM